MKACKIPKNPLYTVIPSFSLTRLVQLMASLTLKAIAKARHSGFGRL